MPFTLAHPAVVVPLSAPTFERPSALGAVVGSMAPDFEYFVRLLAVRTISHDLSSGIPLLCVPSGLVLLWLFQHVVKRPMALLLPRALGRLLPHCNPINDARRAVQVGRSSPSLEKYRRGQPAIMVAKDIFKAMEKGRLPLGAAGRRHRVPARRRQCAQDRLREAGRQGSAGGHDLHRGRVLESAPGGDDAALSGRDGRARRARLRVESPYGVRGGAELRASSVTKSLR